MFDLATDELPIEPTVPRAQRRQCNRADAEFTNNPDQILKPVAYPLQLGGIPPMLLGREVDDPARSVIPGPLRHQHLPNMDFAPTGGVLVGLRAVGECFLEHERDALAHHTLLIDGVDEGFCGRFEQVALRESNHPKNQSGWTSSLRDTPRREISSASRVSWLE